MNKSKFDTIVANRAHERVVAKLEAFRMAIATAFRNLGSDYSSDYYHGFDYKLRNNEGVKTLLHNVSQGLYFEHDEKGSDLKIDGKLVKLKWPRELWKREEEAVQKELLATMDEMQRALVAPSPSSDLHSPAPQEEIISP